MKVKATVLSLVVALLVATPFQSSASAVGKYHAQHQRYANSLWCPQNWRTPYGAKRLIICEAKLYGANVDRAVYVAHRESRFHYHASNSCCHGLFQQHERYWHKRFNDYAPHYFHYSWYSGRTNAVVSLKMSIHEGWGAWGF